MEKEDSGNCLINVSEETYLKNEDCTGDTQHTKIWFSDSYEIAQDKAINNKIHMICEKNSIMKKRSKKKRISTGLTQGCPKKALVAMYHSQISGDKNDIKIRIKKNNFTSQVQVSLSFLQII